MTTLALEGEGRDAMLNEVAMLDQAGMKALTTAIGVLGPRLAAAAMKPRGRRAEDLSIARWFETYKLTAKFPELPGISAEAAELLSGVLSGDEIQAALQELLAVRLTDGSNAEAGQAREVFRLTLATADPSLSEIGPVLAEFYDEQISELVARLEASEPAMLALIRSEALSARMIATLRAIERHTAALSSRPNARSEASFLASYRRHVIEQHGKLEPPDFDRRRRVPIADIYVPAVIYEEIPPERTVVPVPQEPPSLSVWELADRLDRTVLLGDPGGGKTTASNVLMHHFASDEARRLPFLVTLRNYAASDPPERSVVRYIEHELETLYQCPAPSGIVDMLLLTGRAVVVFDGLDELLDSTRRADVATRVEHFGAEYPLAPVLVTSRVVGYDQARLDESQFASFRLGGFREEDVAEYAAKWFALEEGAQTNEAESFMRESESVPDLRANPLLLSLMCILYRGEGSLPRNRAEVYEQCANLLFRRWDSRRHIHRSLRAGHLLEPILRHIAWWLFTRDNTQASVTERELIAATTEFLYGRGFESETDARDAGRQFIEFCRGRMWVFNEAGVAATGEKLYSFTHRTFLEFFAASQLAYDSDTPEKLARVLAPHIARSEWDVVGELAVQIKDATSREGARRIYEELLGERRRRSTEGRSRILAFLARTLRSVDPTPQVTRRLIRETFSFLFSGDPDTRIRALPLSWLLASCEPFLDIASEEIITAIARMTGSSDSETHLNGLRISVSLGILLNGDEGTGAPNAAEGNLRSFWFDLAAANASKYAADIIAASDQHTELREIALMHDLISTEQALRMPGGLSPLMHVQRMRVAGNSWSSWLSDLDVIHFLGHQSGFSTRKLRSVGLYLAGKPGMPWATGSPGYGFNWARLTAQSADEFIPDRFCYLGGAAILLILTESNASIPPQHIARNPTKLGVFCDLADYIFRRFGNTPSGPLPDLPVPDEFKQVFRDWAEGKVNFTAPAPDSHPQSMA